MEAVFGLMSGLPFWFLGASPLCGVGLSATIAAQFPLQSLALG
jgi:hypothetical protein